jgi:hypothetical protein
MLIGHIDACIFWRLDTHLPDTSRWIDTYSYTGTKLFSRATTSTGITSEPVTNASFSTQYLVSFLTALRSLVLKLRESQNDTENIYIIFEFFAGILADGAVFGNIHGIVEMMDSTAVLAQAEEQHKFRMQWLSSYMKQKKLKPELQQVC